MLNPGMAAVAGTLAALMLHEGQPAPLKATASMVLVPVTVRDQRDALVRHLTRETFRISEEGVAREIRTFSEEEGPVSLGIVFDASRSMEHRLDSSRQAIARLFEQRMEGDEYLAVAFNDSPHRMSELTIDPEPVQRALGSIGASGWTSLYDGIYLAAQSMKAASNPRRALLVLSDGEDNFSRHSSADLRRYLREAGVMVFAISMDASGIGSLRGRVLRSLALETGGWHKTVGSMAELGNAVFEMSLGIRSHYVIGFQPGEGLPARKYRRIRVNLEAPRGSTWRVSCRSGYYSPD